MEPIRKQEGQDEIITMLQQITSGYEDRDKILDLSSKIINTALKIFGENSEAYKEINNEMTLIKSGLTEENQTIKNAKLFQTFSKIANLRRTIPLFFKQL